MNGITPQEARRELSRRARVELARRGVQIEQPSTGEKAYQFVQQSVPYLAGAGAGMLGSPMGPEVAIPAAGLGYAGARSGLRGVGRMMGYEKPATLGQETKQTALSDLPIGMALEGAPSVAKNVLTSNIAKRAGRGIADMFGTIPGVDTEYIARLFKNPRSILPPKLGGPPALKEAGAEMGRVEAKLGIPSLESEPIEPLYKVRPPAKVRIANPEREGIDPTKLMQNIDPARRPELEKALQQMKGPTQQETVQETAYRVHKMMTAGETPTVPEAVQALKGTNEALEKFPENMTTAQSKAHLRLTLQAKRLQRFLTENVPELQKARGAYAAGKTREAFTSPAMGLMAKSGGKDVSRMGANRLVGPFALTRIANNPAFAGLLGASQSPLVLGGATAGLGTAAQALQSRLSPYVIASLLQKLRSKKPQDQTMP
jgi:hypothetical protein